MRLLMSLYSPSRHQVDLSTILSKSSKNRDHSVCHLARHLRSIVWAVEGTRVAPVGNLEASWALLGRPAAF